MVGLKKVYNRVLVGITPQSNGKRLIDYANSVSVSVGGELHILHIQKGGDIFKGADAAAVLQDLFDYGSKYGGVIHAMCGDDVAATFKKFIRKHRITHVVLGEAPAGQPAPDSINNQILAAFPEENVYVLEKEHGGEKEGAEA